MNDMPVPKNIDAMIQSMHPVPWKILNHKSDNYSKPDWFQFIDGHMIDQPGIADDGKPEFHTITNCICDTKTQIRYHIC